jgi:hypothetical protein
MLAAEPSGLAEVRDEELFVNLPGVCFQFSRLNPRCAESVKKTMPTSSVPPGFGGCSDPGYEIASERDGKHAAARRNGGE